MRVAMGMDASASQPYIQIKTGVSPIMRLLLYIVALLTGFTAAEAARPVSAAAQTNAASPVQLMQPMAAVAAVHTSQVLPSRVEARLLDQNLAAVPAMVRSITLSTPVSRAERARE